MEVKRWPNAIPLPDQGNERKKTGCRETDSIESGSRFSGSFLTGVSLPNCLDASEFEFS